MTDLLHVLPDFDTSQFTHLLPSLEKSLVSVSDILILDSLDVAKRASIPSAEVKKLRDVIVAGLQQQIEPVDVSDQLHLISTLDKELDATLSGGIPTGHLTEITGESAAGKTQLLLSFCLAVQLPRPLGLSRSALYVTTEGPLQTNRLSQILRFNPILDSIAPPLRPSLSRIHSIKASDLEAQDHILRYQVPVAIERHDIGLIVIDSIAANFRAEFDLPAPTVDKHKGRRLAFDERNRQLVSLGAHLRRLAGKYDLVVVVANQVLDRFSPVHNDGNHASHGSQLSRTSSQHLSVLTSSPRPASRADLSAARDSSPLPTDTGLDLSTSDPLSLEHQMRFTTGWGDIAPSSYHLQSANDQDRKSDFPEAADPHLRAHRLYHAAHPKTPSLGHIWTSQLSARIVILKSPVYRDHDWRLGLRERDVARWRRGVKVVFAAWIPAVNVEENDGQNSGSGEKGGVLGYRCEIGNIGKEVEIWEGGVRAAKDSSSGGLGVEAEAEDNDRD